MSTNDFYMQKSSLPDSVSSLDSIPPLRLPSPAIPIPSSPADQRKMMNQSNSGSMGDRRKTSNSDWLPDWAQVQSTNRSQWSQESTSGDTAYIDTLRRQQYQPYYRPTSNAGPPYAPRVYKPYRGVPTKAPSYTSEVTMPTLTYRVTEDKCATSPLIPRRMSFKFNTKDDSITIGKSYNRMVDKFRKLSTDKHSRTKLVKRRSTKEATPVVDETWIPSPGSSFELVSKNDSPVSPFVEVVTSAKNRKPRSPSPKVPSPVFRPTLERFRQQQAGDALDGNGDTFVNFSRKGTLRKSNTVRETQDRS